MLLYCNIDNIEEMFQEDEKKYNQLQNAKNTILNDTKPRYVSDQTPAIYESQPQSNSRKTNIKHTKTKDSKKLKIHCYLDANHGKAIELHVVMIYDNELCNMFKAMDTMKYKQNYNMLLRENLNSIEVFKIEVIPGKSCEQIEMPIKDNAVLIDCIIFGFIMNKDVNPYKDNEAVSYDKIIRKVLIGKQEYINLIINRYGLFMHKIN